MAIDTAAKRFSIMGFGALETQVVPSGTVDAAERATFLNLYSGIALDVPVVVDSTNKLVRSLTDTLVTELVLS